MNAIQREMSLVVATNGVTEKPAKRARTIMARIDQTTVYLRRFGVVSESSELYSDWNLCNHVEAIRPACNKLLSLDTYPNEVCVVLSLNNKCRLTGATIVTVGTLDASLIHSREVFQAAIMNNSASVIIVHNHPSGDPTPSKEDIDVTRRLIESGRILNIPVRDHVILGDERAFAPGFYSVRHSGVVEFD